MLNSVSFILMAALFIWISFFPVPIHYQHHFVVNILVGSIALVLMIKNYKDLIKKQDLFQYGNVTLERQVTWLRKMVIDDR